MLWPSRRFVVVNYFVYPYAEADGGPVTPPGVDVHFRRMAADEADRADEVAR